MSEPLPPGVSVNEVPSGPRPIEGVATSTAAFLGETERGPIRPQLVTSVAEYADTFGGVFLPDRYLPHAVRGFFENGGKRLYVARVVGSQDAPSGADYAGEVDAANGRLEPQGLAALAHDDFRDVALVYAPFPAGDPSNTIAKLIVQHCEAHRFRFAIIDAPNVDPTTLNPRDQVTGIADTAFAAFYAPWLVVADPATGATVTVPPGGHVLGTYVRVDTERGVQKAPANELVRGATGLAFAVTDAIQDQLNPRGVNAIRALPSRGIRIWGARTLSSNSLWKYVNVRRLFIFLERSIYEGTQWVVFEPNDERLWSRVRDTIRLFLRAQWRAGALFGRTEEEAFFITCDRTTMTQDDILNGRLICEVGIAPVRPAEFVIFRIFQHTVEATS
jgi:Bacteriophage tail sheath protein